MKIPVLGQVLAECDGALEAAQPFHEGTKTMGATARPSSAGARGRAARARSRRTWRGAGNGTMAAIASRCPRPRTGLRSC